MFIFSFDPKYFEEISRDELLPSTGSVITILTVIRLSLSSTSFVVALYAYLDIANARPRGIRSGHSSLQIELSSCEALTCLLLQITLRIQNRSPCRAHCTLLCGRSFVAKQQAGKNEFQPGGLLPFMPLLHLVLLVPPQGPPDRREGSSRCRVQSQQGWCPLLRLYRLAGMTLTVGPHHFAGTRISPLRQQSVSATICSRAKLNSAGRGWMIEATASTA
jgi:hypothetical protein